MNNRILLLTECGHQIGSGHITRCLSLAHAFQEAGKTTELWVVSDEPSQTRLLAGARAINWHDLSGKMAAAIEEAYAVVVDSLLLTALQIKHIEQISHRFVVLDDWHRRTYNRGIVIDWTIGADRFAYPQRSPGVLYLLGETFCALRPEFSVTTQRTFPDPPQRILVTFGGSDLRQLTVPVLSRLVADFPEWEKQVVVGESVQDKSFVNAVRDEHTTFYVGCDASKMRTLMSEADLAISAGGQTLYELASQGLPPVVVRVTDNQQDDIREFGAAGFAEVIGDWNMPGLLSAVAAGIRTLWPAAERRRRSAIGRRCIDGFGAERLVAACLKHWREGSADGRLLNGV